MKELVKFGAYIMAVVFICLTSLVRLVKHFHQFPAPAFIDSIITVSIYESKFRDRLQPKEDLIRKSGIKRGMTVMELGCGPGAYTADFARAVGEKGKLYAVDLKTEMIERLKSKLARPEYRDISNVETKVAGAYELPLADGSIDLAVLVAVLPEIPGKNRALKEISRVLKPDGTLTVSEILIDPDYPVRKTTRKYCEQAGFEMIKSGGNFFGYTMQFRKARLAA
jgi:ubiquinone/menaquinone biosynthesis C-methylase UbiE